MGDQISSILITGALGQIGSELTPRLREVYGKENVVAIDSGGPPWIRTAHLRPSTSLTKMKCVV